MNSPELSASGRESTCLGVTVSSPRILTESSIGVEK